MNKRSIFIAAAVLLVVSFLGGYLLRLNEIRELRTELSGERERLEASHEQLRKCQFQARLSDLRDVISLTYLQAVKNNFDEASKYSTRYFDLVRQASDLAADASMKSEMEEILTQRDLITSQLAKADASARDSIQRLMETTFEATREE